MKKGFTLAETLITLVIIGVIAAITVPNLIIKHQKEETVTRLKKAYTILSQAIRLSEIDNGNTQTWDFNLDAKYFYDKYLKKYLTKTKDFGYINVSNFGVDYTTPQGILASTFGWDLNSLVYRIVLNDGMMLFISDLKFENYRTVYVDINGFRKPNKIGRDLFALVVHKNHKLAPYGFDMENKYNDIIDNFGTFADRNKLVSQSYNRACNKNSLGFWCAALIITDGWKISDDYPW